MQRNIGTEGDGRKQIRKPLRSRNLKGRVEFLGKKGTVTELLKG